jgi:hypothetical protein
MGEPGSPADGAASISGLAVEFRGPQQVRMGIADIGDSRSSREHGRKRCAARKTVVDD